MRLTAVEQKFKAREGLGAGCAMPSTSVWSQLRDFFWSDPLLGVAVAAAVVALATTPMAFAILGRMGYFYARRGRVIQKPSFSAVVVAMMLVMGIPAIFCALVVKSRYFDRNRYEFDPNRVWTVLDQGRGYQSREEINQALRAEMERLARERKGLVESVKKLDEALLALRAAAAQSPATAQAMPEVLQRLAGVRKVVGLDGPQQLMDFTAPPVELGAARLPAAIAAGPAPAAPVAVSAPAPTVPARAGGGLTPVEAQRELSAVPEPQRALASMLPLTDLPPGWELGKDMGASGKARLETFNAENLYEKIDGRAESFVQYDVKGMAYTFYHPAGDDSGEVQLYIFEFGNALKALGKYGSEKPEDAQPIALGAEGYTTAGSTFFYMGKYYVQLIANQDDPKYAAFALELAKRIAAQARQPQAPAATAATSPETPVKPGAATPEALFALLPAEPKRSGPKFVPEDVFGYSFLSDVFMADYKEGEVAWQGFLRPYPTPEAAQAVFNQYVASAKQDGAELKMVEAEGADRMVISANIGLVDVIFQKGNVLAGANGATEAGPAERFARAFAKSLPTTVPFLESEKKSTLEDMESTEKQKE
jgi:hypothetical protein